MKQYAPDLLWSVRREDRIKECCNVLRFIDLSNGVYKLYKANFCKYDKFCLACATRRAIIMLQRFEQGIVQNWLEYKHWYHITLTIKHSPTDSLPFLMDKLWKAKEKLAQRFRNSKRGNHKNKSFMHNFEGMISSVEITHGKNGWHPHIHMLVCGEKEVSTEYSKALWTESNRELQKEWYSLTGDSYSVGIRKIDVNKGNFSRKWIGEVFKYAVKFSKLSVPQLIEVIRLQKNRQYRFFASYGVFRRWKHKNHRIQHDIWLPNKKLLSFFCK